MSEKIFKLALAKSINPDAKTVDGYISTFEWDRDQERFVKGAWDLAQFMKNPVVLWAHDGSQPPIGKALSIIEDDFGLRATTQFDEKSEDAMRIFGLFQRGFLNAFSVGFIRKDYKMEDLGSGTRGLSITSAELYEYSAVSVPANPGALVGREVAEMAMKALGPKSIEILKTKSLGEQFLVLPAGVEVSDEPETPESVEQEKSIEVVLKNVIELARTVKGQPLDDSKRGLILTANQVFGEILGEEPGRIDKDGLLRLKKAMEQLGELVTVAYPGAAAAVQKTISQIDRAVTGQAA